MKKSQKSRKSQKKMRKNEQDWKRKDRTRFWMKRLEDDLGLMTIPAVEAPCMKEMRRSPAQDATRSRIRTQTRPMSKELRR